MIVRLSLLIKFFQKYHQNVKQFGRFVGPDLGPDCLPCLSAEDTHVDKLGYSADNPGYRQRVNSFPTSVDCCYRKVPKFSEARNFAVIHLKFKQRGQT